MKIQFTLEIYVYTGKHLRQSLFLNKAAGFRPATLLKKRLWRRRFPVNFVKFLRTPFLQHNCKKGWLLLLIAEKTIILKFLDFQFFLFTVLWKIKRNRIIGLFCTTNLLEVYRKKRLFFKFLDFNSRQTKMK